MKDLLARRAERLGPNVSTFYEEPIHIVRGEGVWLWDADGRKYLDCYNNVPHVGHCHPHVVEAIARQAAVLNTHTRYLHAGIVDYADRLTSTFNHDLDQLIMVCTGSEANDIALRMAQAVTGKIGIVATDNTYHGNTMAVSQLSTRRPPIGGYPDHVKLIPAPDSVTPVGGILGGQAEAFAANLEKAIAELNAADHGFSGVMLCPSFANEGLPDLEPGFLDKTAEVVRRAGGLLLCDEVQPGFGRVGDHWWGHDWMGFVPDVVTVGKPMANGHPAAAVITRPDIMATFRNAFGYFNTFGGNPVSCAAAMATLEVIETDNLVAHAGAVGRYTLAKLKSLVHPKIAQVRGQGMFFGVEFCDPDGTPATQFAGDIVEDMRRRGVLLNRIGKHKNILKIRPPMPFAASHADIAVGQLADALKDRQDA
ncbi:aspartate aminotransferase family protein [Algirhabdus cladophorae]|uniref:aspartate aminotransferase family protein n=1 Tax=Algirhabdus cladophorae TaxID=3377108 RepID=UPI003B8474C9